MKRGFQFVLLGLVVAATPSASLFAESSSSPLDYVLLSLGGHNVKWGTPRLGTPAVIRYTFLDAPLVRKDGRNCRSMRPFPDRLSRGGTTASQISGEFRAAFAAWQAVAGVRFEEVQEADAADLVLGAQESSAGIAYADLKHRPTTPSSISTIRKAAICLNPHIHWNIAFDGDNETFDIRYVALHEIGHIIGLDHAWSRRGTIMNFKYRETVREPQPADIAGAKLLYGDPEHQRLAREPSPVASDLLAERREPAQAR